MFGFGRSVEGPIIKKRLAKTILLLNFLFTLHYTLAIYINSSYLQQFVSVDTVGLGFTIAALLAVIFLFQSERFLVDFGDKRVTLAALFVDAAALAGLIVSGIFSEYIHPLLPFLFFILHFLSAVFILRFALDVFFKANTDDSATGFARGELLTAANLAWIISPFLMSTILTDGDYWKIYSLSFAIVLLLVPYVYYSFYRGEEPEYKHAYFWDTLKMVREDKDFYRVFMMTLILRIFLSWIIIYLPIYLHETIGFSWSQIGIMLAIMLIPNVLLDIPWGYLADRFFGEKELLTAGFVITAIFTGAIGFVTEHSVILWGALLFGTHIGSSMLEVMAETYFFKKVHADDGNMIGFFRNTLPLAYIIAPVVASAFLSISGMSEAHLFILLAAIILYGVRYSLVITDTK